MMSYTIPCTSLCSRLGTLIRRTSPCTRIIGGSPAERWRSEALFLTEKARSSAMSILSIPCRRGAAEGVADGDVGLRLESRIDYVLIRRFPASVAPEHFFRTNKGIGAARGAAGERPSRLAGGGPRSIG